MRSRDLECDDPRATCLGEFCKPTFRGSEMNHVSVFLEHIDLLNCLNGLHVELLQRSLQLLVIGARSLVHFLLFSPWCSFAPKSQNASAS